MHALLTSIFALLISVGLASAQQTAEPTSPMLPRNFPAQTNANAPTSNTEPTISTPPPGDYKRLTLWQEIKLSNAYYTNPQLVQNVAVAYSYNPTDFTSYGKDYQLFALAVDGRIAFGIAHEDTVSIVAVPAQSILRTYKVRNPADLKSTLQAEDLKVIAAQPSLLGEKAETTLVKTMPPNPPK